MNIKVLNGPIEIKTETGTIRIDENGVSARRNNHKVWSPTVPITRLTRFLEAFSDEDN